MGTKYFILEVKGAQILDSEIVRLLKRIQFKR